VGNCVKVLSMRERPSTVRLHRAHDQEKRPEARDPSRKEPSGRATAEPIHQVLPYRPDDFC
jgi:hypothetical protein